MGRGLDFLTVTMGTEAAEELLAWMPLREEGRPTTGFAKSERRDCIGGWCWRKFEPFAESKEWGRRYESWEWASGLAGLAVGTLPDAVRASRVDVAWDFQCDGSYTADKLVELVKPHAKSKRIKLGISGEGGVNTHYVGSRQSERRLRIYRRDLREGKGLFEFVPKIRVELELHGEAAAAWVALFQSDRDAAYAAAAKHVHEASGLRVGVLGEVPELEVRPEVEPAAELWQFLEQHGERVLAWHEAGVGLVQLARRFQRLRSRMTEWRSQRRRRLFGRVDWAAVRDLICTKIAIERAALVRERSHRGSPHP